MDRATRTRVAAAVRHASAATAGVGGWCIPEKGEWLLREAAALPAGPVIEVGSYMGKSAIWIGSGRVAVHGPGQRVWCVDSFAGEDPDGCLGQGRCYDDVCRCQNATQERGSTFDRFVANIDAAGLATVCLPLIGWSIDVAASYTGGKAVMLFIDGGHRYSQVRGDYDAWIGHCAPGATLVFDDSKHKDVARLMDELEGDPRVERARRDPVDRAVKWRVL